MARSTRIDDRLSEVRANFPDLDLDLALFFFVNTE